MKTRKLFLVLVLVVVLLAGTVLVASAAKKIRLTGGTHQPFSEAGGHEWFIVNAALDPVTGEAEGKALLKVHPLDEYPQYWAGWTGEPVCGALGDIGGVPTISLVIQIVEQKDIDPTWVGKYLKLSISDGGQNASEDMVSVLAWDFEKDIPLSGQPLCDFQLPSYNASLGHGNFTIHD